MYRLEVKNLSIAFTQYSKGLRQKTLNVITELNVNLKPGEVMAVVGASGSGKSLLAHAILGILPDNAVCKGGLYYEGEVLNDIYQKKLRGTEIALIPQSINFLDPLMCVGNQITTKRYSYNTTLIRKILQRYCLKEGTEKLFPFQLSGGMARRVLVATAVVGNARLIIADEPTPGLHTVIVEETLLHLRELANLGAGVLLITHDLEAALQIADRVAVFYAGTTVEIAAADSFFGRGEALLHPYSRALWRALPANGFEAVAGFQPYPENLPTGCLYHPRCHMCTKDCMVARPSIIPTKAGMVRCIHAA